MNGKTNATPENVINNVAKMLNNPQFSDVTIKIFDVEIYAHQFIICIQSEYFRKAFQKPDPKTPGFAESASMTIQFNEGSGAAYWRVLEYFYTGDYSELLSTDVFDDDPELLKHVRVHTLADMFQINDLKALSEKKLQKALDSFEVSETTSEFADCVRAGYSDTSRFLSVTREAMVIASVRNLGELGKEQGKPVMLKYGYIRDLIRDCGDFAVDLTHQMCMDYMTIKMCKALQDKRRLSAIDKFYKRARCQIET
ncbi:hypothetical protein K3495_g10808 [Podosphaera aphanis]|nr:hypothetical protein K3495_g10808 [Podosphaera aphanis]